MFRDNVLSNLNFLEQNKQKYDIDLQPEFDDILGRYVPLCLLSSSRNY